jgi:transcriptional regulator
MYLPKQFEVTDPATLHQVVREHALATWATVLNGEPVVNHIPFLLDPTRGEHGTLIGHVARANPVWRTPAPSVLVFQGPGAYISPNWYPSKHQHGKMVPTWNYAVVHAHGMPQIVEEAAPLLAIVTRLTNVHESKQAHPWAVADAPTDYIDNLLKAIVGIEIRVQRWVGKFKLAQHYAVQDRVGTIAGLQRINPADPVAALMKVHGPT